MSVVINYLTHECENKWDDYAETSGASIYHFSRWRHLIKKNFGHESYYLYAVDSANAFVGILPLIRLKSALFGDFLISMPYFNYGGVVADDNEIELELVRSAEELRKNLGCSHVELRDAESKEYELPVRTDKVTVLLDLPSDADILWKSIGSKRRAQINRPIREGVLFVTGGIELLKEFYQVFSVNMRDLGTPVYGYKFFEDILNLLGKNAIIAVVRLNNKPVAAGFLLGNKGRLEIPWASTLRKFNHIGVNMYLYWNILKYAIENGYQTFDFGRSSHDAGTLKFKKQWGGSTKQLYWHYLLADPENIPSLNPANAKFKLAISIWQKLPVFITNYLGPAIVKNLP
jgi:FemAB-related protein (PEP-CTERM system-associated)